MDQTKQLHSQYWVDDEQLLLWSQGILPQIQAKPFEHEVNFRMVPGILNTSGVEG